MTLKSSISVSGIERLRREVDRYRQDLKNKTDALVSQLISEGADIAREECPIRTGNLYNSIVDEFSGNGKGFIRVKCDYAVYVEFGTGLRGANTPHPDKSLIGFDFEYDRNGYGAGGWWYPTDDNDPNPTKYTAKDGTMYAWTGGMPSRPFMYNTAQRIKSKF